MNNADPGETNRSLTAINLPDGKEEESCRLLFALYYYKDIFMMHDFIINMLRT